MDKLLKDLRYGARMLAKHPGMTFVSLIALTLGIGLTTTTFSIVYGALYRGLPFEAPDRIMHLERNNLAEDIQSMEVAVHDFVDWREQQTSFETISGFYQGTVNLSGVEGRPVRYDGAFMTPGGLRVTGVTPLLGRTFLEGEERPGAPLVVVFGYDMWRTRFDADPDVIGRTVRINGEQATVVGVMPQGFQFPLREEIWVPMRQDPAALERGQGLWLEVVGRLKPEVSRDQALAEMSTIARRLEQEYPETNRGVGVVIKPYTEEYVGEEPAALLYTMLGAVFMVLLIACANVANLLLSQAASRTREVAVRSALGARRRQVVSQFLAETFVLAAVGGALGLGLSVVGVRAFNAAIVDAEPPFWIDIRTDYVAAGFVMLLVLVTTLIAGLVPAIKASGANVNEILKDESRGSSSFRMGRLSRALVVTEIALSCGLLTAAGLTVKSVVKLRNIDFAFARESVFTARIGLFESQYPDEASRLAFYRELVDRLAAVPGARTASLGTGLPGGAMTGGSRFAVEGAVYETDQDYPIARQLIAAPGYFEAFDVDVVQGRDFTWQDDEGDIPAVIVNQSFARRHFPNEDPIGRRIRMGTSESEAPWLSIVGIVPDLHVSGPENESPEGIYLPLAQNDVRFLFLLLGTPGNPMGLTSAVRDAVFGVDPDLPLYWVRSLDDVIQQSTWFYRVFGTLFMIFGAVALFLASIGLYGVMAFSVARRTSELGVRMALGAQGVDVMRVVLRQGMIQLGIGVALGLLLAVGLSHLLQIILFQVEPRDPLIFGSIVVLLVAIGVAASYVPARRATRIDPMLALRYE